MKIWYEPKVTVVGATYFAEPVDLEVGWEGDNCPASPERLVEFAGRTCYQSFSNPSGKTTTAYIENILKQGHGSVLEHASWSLLIEGVSRSLTHELVRHRAGTAFSQLSQRYVEHIEAVIPPAILELEDKAEGVFEGWVSRASEACLNYQDEIVQLTAAGMKGKALKEAARSLLPNCAETKIVMTANARAWRHIIELRSGEGADAEIRRLFRVVLAVLKAEAPALFGDFSDEGVPKYSKV